MTTLLPAISGSQETLITLTDQSIGSLRWTNGDWEVAGENVLLRGDAEGWRTNDGIMVFGGWGDNGDDSTDVRLINNEFVNAGKLVDTGRLVLLGT